MHCGTTYQISKRHITMGMCDCKHQLSIFWFPPTSTNTKSQVEPNSPEEESQGTVERITKRMVSVKKESRILLLVQCLENSCPVSWQIRPQYFLDRHIRHPSVFFLIFFGVGCSCHLGPRLRMEIRHNNLPCFGGMLWGTRLLSQSLHFQMLIEMSGKTRLKRSQK